MERADQRPAAEVFYNHPMPNPIQNYFNLAIVGNLAIAGGNYVVPQYLTLVAGIIIQPYFAKYQESRTWPNFSDLSGWIVFSIIVGIVIFPGVYKRTFDPNSPLFVQLCSIFVGGLGWQSLLTTAAKLIPSNAPEAKRGASLILQYFFG